MSRMKDTLPYAAGSDTSREAAESIKEAAPSYEEKVLDYIRSQGLWGATADECLVALGLTHQNGSARVSTLAKHGRIYKTNRTRKTRSGRNAAVYCAVRGGDQ